MNDIQRAGRRVEYHSWQVQYILIHPEIKPSNIVNIIYEADSSHKYYSHVHCVSIQQTLQLSQCLLKSSGFRQTCVGLPFLSCKNMVALNYLTTIVKHLYIACLSLYLVICLNYSWQKFQAIDAKLFYLSAIPTQSG